MTIRNKICDFLSMQPESTDKEICTKLEKIIGLKKQYSKELQHVHEATEEVDWELIDECLDESGLVRTRTELKTLRQALNAKTGLSGGVK